MRCLETCPRLFWTNAHRVVMDVCPMIQLHARGVSSLRRLNPHEWIGNEALLSVAFDVALVNGDGHSHDLIILIVWNTAVGRFIHVMDARRRGRGVHVWLLAVTGFCCHLEETWVCGSDNE